ncbi:hypothetical protein [Sphingobacterium siyangense]|uniref:hypothetical protein n=1 Tax=Sphingobacterium siyangense TaxID=459529 RepID=UPI00301B4D06
MKIRLITFILTVLSLFAFSNNSRDICQQHNLKKRIYANDSLDQKIMQDSIIKLKRSLDLIKRTYGIYTKTDVVYINDKKNIATTKISGAEIIDSALILLPYFRERLKKTEKDEWLIDKVGKEYEIVKQHYLESIKDYNNLNKKHRIEIEKYESKIKLYMDILYKMSEKGLVKIDTVEGGYQYIY